MPQLQNLGLVSQNTKYLPYLLKLVSQNTEYLPYLLKHGPAGKFYHDYNNALLSEQDRRKSTRNIVNSIGSAVGNISSGILGNTEDPVIGGISGAVDTGLNFIVPGLGTASSVARNLGNIAGDKISNGYSNNTIDTIRNVTDPIPIVNTAVDVLGGIGNRLFGSKINQDYINTVNNDINNIRDWRTNATSWTRLNADLNNIPTLNGVNKSKVGSDGIWSNNAAAKEYNKLNNKYNSALDVMGNRIKRAEDNIYAFNTNSMSKNYLNNYAAGGNLFTNGLQFNNGLSYINTGNTHENNPYEGVPVSINQQDGEPNLVEEGEVIANNEYVFSNRLKVPDDVAKHLSIPRGKTFADAIKLIAKESEELPNDPIIKKGLEHSKNILRQAQEQIKAINQQEEALNQQKIQSQNTIDSLLGKAPEIDPSMLEQQEEQNNSQEDLDALLANSSLYDYADGGKIHIKEKNKGKFTESANRAGMGVQEYASHILANPDNYSSTLVKRANFARNAAKWKHAEGGHLFRDGGPDNDLDSIYNYYTSQFSPTEPTALQRAKAAEVTGDNTAYYGTYDDIPEINNADYFQKGLLAIENPNRAHMNDAIVAPYDDRTLGAGLDFKSGIYAKEIQQLLNSRKSKQHVNGYLTKQEYQKFLYNTINNHINKLNKDLNNIGVNWNSLSKEAQLALLQRSWQTGNATQTINRNKNNLINGNYGNLLSEMITGSGMKDTKEASSRGTRLANYIGYDPVASYIADQNEQKGKTKLELYPDVDPYLLYDDISKMNTDLAYMNAAQLNEAKEQATYNEDDDEPSFLKRFLFGKEEPTPIFIDKDGNVIDPNISLMEKLGVPKETTETINNIVSYVTDPISNIVYKTTGNEDLASWTSLITGILNPKGKTGSKNPKGKTGFNRLARKDYTEFLNTYGDPFDDFASKHNHFLKNENKAIKEIPKNVITRRKAAEIWTKNKYNNIISNFLDYTHAKDPINMPPVISRNSRRVYGAKVDAHRRALGEIKKQYGLPKYLKDYKRDLERIYRKNPVLLKDPRWRLIRNSAAKRLLPLATGYAAYEFIKDKIDDNNLYNTRAAALQKLGYTNLLDSDNKPTTYFARQFKSKKGPVYYNIVDITGKHVSTVGSDSNGNPVFLEDDKDHYKDFNVTNLPTTPTGATPDKKGINLNQFNFNVSGVNNNTNNTNSNTNSNLDKLSEEIDATELESGNTPPVKEEQRGTTELKSRSTTPVEQEQFDDDYYFPKGTGYAYGGHLFDGGGYYNIDDDFLNTVNRARFGTEGYLRTVPYDPERFSYKESDPAYQDFTNYIVKGFTDNTQWGDDSQIEAVKNYLKTLDWKYLDDTGNVIKDRASEYARLRKDDKWGPHHWTPKLTTPTNTTTPPNTTNPVSTPTPPAIPTKDTTTTPSTPLPPLEPLPYENDMLRYAPLGFNTGSLLYNLRPTDYRAADEIDAASRLNPISLPTSHISDYRRRNPFDESYLANLINQNAAANARASANYSNGNRATQLGSLAARDYALNQALGQLGYQSYLANRTDDESVAAFNRATNQYNADIDNNMNLQLANINNNREQFTRQNLINNAAYRQSLRDQRDVAIANDLQTLSNNLSELGKQAYDRNNIIDYINWGILHTPYGRRTNSTKETKKTKEIKKDINSINIPSNIDSYIPHPKSSLSENLFRALYGESFDPNIKDKLPKKTKKTTKTEKTKKDRKKGEYTLPLPALEFIQNMINNQNL